MSDEDVGTDNGSGTGNENAVLAQSLRRRQKGRFRCLNDWFLGKCSRLVIILFGSEDMMKVKNILSIENMYCIRSNNAANLS